MAKTLDTSRKVILTGRLKHYIDLNTDYGQSQDRAFFEREDDRLLNYVSSVNLPCCVHDGNPAEIRRGIAQAKTYHCAVGAHLGLPDPVNYGYLPVDISDAELVAWIHVQMGAFQALARAEGLEVEHVRPHGALYGFFVNDPERAGLVARTLLDIDRWTLLVGPAGPVLEKVSEETGIRIAREVYLGKRYSAQGTLIKERFHEDLNPQGVLDQVKQLLNEGSLTSVDGRTIPVRFETLHLSPRLDGVSDVAEKIHALIGQPVSLPMAVVGESGWI